MIRQQLPEKPKGEELHSDYHQNKPQRKKRETTANRTIDKPQAGNVRGDGEAREPKACSQGCKVAGWPTLVSNQEKDDRKVEHPPQDPITTVARLAVLTRCVWHLDLSHLKPLPVGEEWDKSVKASNQNKVLDNLATHDLETTVNVTKTGAPKPAHEPVEHCRAKNLPTRILAMPSPGTDEIQARGKTIGELHDLGRILLQIRVDRGNQLATSTAETRSKSHRLAEMTPESYHSSPRIFPRQLREHSSGPVGATIIDKDNFRLTRKRLDQASMELGK